MDKRLQMAVKTALNKKQPYLKQSIKSHWRRKQLMVEGAKVIVDSTIKVVLACLYINSKLLGGGGAHSPLAL